MRDEPFRDRSLRDEDPRAFEPARRVGIREPAGNWEIGLSTLVLGGKCPWCGGLIDLPGAVRGADGLHWTCEGRCNP